MEKIRIVDTRTKGDVGLTITIGLQSKYKPKKKSASLTVHTNKTPEQVRDLIKKLLGGFN